MADLAPQPSGSAFHFDEGHGIDYIGGHNIACALDYYNQHAGSLLGDETADPLICDCHGDIECDDDEKGQDVRSCPVFNDAGEEEWVHEPTELRARASNPQSSVNNLDKRGNKRTMEYKFTPPGKGTTLVRGTVTSWEVSSPRTNGMKAMLIAVASFRAWRISRYFTKVEEGLLQA